MRRKTFLSIVLTICGISFASSTDAQTMPAPPRKADTLLGRIQETFMGKSHLLESKHATTGSPTRVPTAHTRMSASSRTSNQKSLSAGRVIQHAPPHQAKSAAVPVRSTPTGRMPTQHSLPAHPMNRTTGSVKKLPTASSAYRPPSSPLATQSSVGGSSFRSTPTISSANSSRSSSSSPKRPSRLYERMTALRHSAFADEPGPKSGEVQEAPTSSPAVGSTPSTAGSVVSSGPAKRSTPATPSVKTSPLESTPAAIFAPTSANRRLATSRSVTPTPMVGSTWPTTEPIAAARPVTPLTARRIEMTPSPAYSRTASRSIANAPLATRKTDRNLAAASRSTVSSTVNVPTVAKTPSSSSSMTIGRPTRAPLVHTTEPSGPMAPASGDRVLFSRQSPVLGLETIGPRRIIVGKESVYEITLRNTGPVAAEQTAVLIDLPVWADVRGAEASTGSTSSSPVMDGTRQFRWQIGRLDAAAEERLMLRIVPLESRPFELAMRWDYKPAASQTLIEVQEPKLELALQGPREVLYGEKEMFRLEIANTGTGEAADVKIVLQPLGAGDNLPASHNIGTLQAGDKKVIEVELTARQVGNLLIKIDATGDGVEAHLAQRILVLRSALELSVEVPPMQFVGSQATYRVRLRNPGTAPAKNVVVTVSIPLGTKYVSCGQNGLAGPAERSVTWTHEELPPGDETSFLLTCQMEAAGPKRLEVASTAASDVTASGEGTVLGEAMADLMLTVDDPAGPVLVGTDAFYELEVRNRGTKSAEDVEIVAYFSQGVEPLKVEGGQCRIGPGQVVFDNITSLAAGQKIVFKIKARADISGNHVFRVEVHCKPIGTRLVSEETTYFYGDTLLSKNRPKPDSRTSPLRDREIRTANRPQPPTTVSPTTGPVGPSPATRR